jgi:hypothetical protein
MDLSLSICQTCFKRAPNHMTSEAWEAMPEMLQNQVAGALCGDCLADHLEQNL